MKIQDEVWRMSDEEYYDECIKLYYIRRKKFVMDY